MLHTSRRAILETLLDRVGPSDADLPRRWSVRDGKSVIEVAQG